MTQIQTTIIEKGKKELNVKYDIDMFSLYDLLYETRNNSHPDKFPDELKKDAEEKFKKLNGLLIELKFFIEQNKLNTKPSELVLYKEKYAGVDDKNKILSLEDENKRLDSKISVLENKLEDLRTDIEIKNRSDAKTTYDELINLYKPKKNEIVVLSVSVFLLIIVNIVNQLNDIQLKLLQLIPVPQIYLSSTLLIILGALTVQLLLKNFKRKKVIRISHELVSQKFIEEFYFRYKKEEDHKYYIENYFLEKDVESYIHEKYNKSRYLKSLVYYITKPFYINDYKSLNHLKEIFIYNLITKRLVEIGKTKNMDRSFKII